MSQIPSEQASDWQADQNDDKPVLKQLIDNLVDQEPDNANEIVASVKNQLHAPPFGDVSHASDLPEFGRTDDDEQFFAYQSDADSDFGKMHLDVGGDETPEPVTPPGNVVVIADQFSSDSGLKKGKSGEVAVLPGVVPLPKLPTPMEEANNAKKEIIEHRRLSSSTIEMLGSAVMQRREITPEKSNVDECTLAHPLHVKLELEYLGNFPKPFSSAT
ncbi:hypothetical protein ACHAPU_008443 [Fusarium lateritium]